ncbi:MAG: peptidylprolyl isomerase, partial [bacterium]
DRMRGPERRIRHILVAAETTAADQERTQTRAEEVARRLREGAPFSEFRDEGTRFGIPDSLTIGESQLDEFPTPYAEALRAASEGEVVGPVGFEMGEQDLQIYAVAVVDELREAGEFTYEDVRGQIRERLRQERFAERLLERLRARTYVDIRL